ncbi:MAG TPA: RidA family protein [Actinomycetota bacterium]|nr:RidA family protein [Actinomycetota bacterium]
MTTPHEIVRPLGLANPVGFSHAVVAGPGRTVYLGGQTGHDASGELVSDDLVEQFDRAAANVVTALRAAGAEPDHLVSMQIFVTDTDDYVEALADLAPAYQRHFGKHYPAIALLQVVRLFDPGAKVELVAVAVVPD